VCTLKPVAPWFLSDYDQHFVTLFICPFLPLDCNVVQVEVKAHLGTAKVKKINGT
jgi:hypothetical protein